MENKKLISSFSNSISSNANLKYFNRSHLLLITLFAYFLLWSNKDIELIYKFIKAVVLFLIEEKY